MVPGWIIHRLFMLCLFRVSAGGLGQEIMELKPKSSNATLGRLADYLMDGYNKGVRPVQNWSQVTTVTLGISIFAILGVDEKNQAITSYFWVNQSWVDEFLTWDPMKFDNVTKISIPINWIWVPDVTVIERLAAETATEIGYVYVTHNGTIFNNKPMQLVTACNLNIYYFPFDQQNCSITFSSWIHSINDVNVYFVKNKHNMAVPSAYYENDGEWDLVEEITSHREYVANQDLSFGEAKLYIVIKRKVLFYVVNLILPSMLLMILDIVGFYIPPESGERVSFKITLLLGYSVLLSYTSDKQPATGTPLIGVYFIMCIVMMVISLMESILIVRIVHNQKHLPTVPMWLKKLVFEKMSLLVCLKPVAPNTDQSGRSENSAEKIENYKKEKSEDDRKQLPMTHDQELLLSIRNEIVSIREHLKNQDHEPITMVWLQIGYIVDKFLFQAYLIVLLVYAVVLTAIWAQWYFQ